jgi:hypothetical protein
LRVTLAQLDWPTLLAKHPSWSFDVVTSERHCADGRPPLLTTVTPETPGGFEEGPVRSHCFSSVRPKASKLITFNAPNDVAAKLRARLALIRAPLPATTILTITSASGVLEVTGSLFLPI